MLSSSGGGGGGGSTMTTGGGGTKTGASGIGTMKSDSALYAQGDGDVAGHAGAMGAGRIGFYGG